MLLKIEAHNLPKRAQKLADRREGFNSPLLTLNQP